MTRPYLVYRGTRTSRLAAGLAALVAALLAGAATGQPEPATHPAADPADPTSQVDAAEDATCRIVQIDMTPSDDLQIVVWVEDAAGNYVDTAFITQLTGRYGMGNRPGIMEFNSAYRWPYGRRVSTFPVWAHRHGMSWPLVVFQDGDDRDLSHAMSQSSIEHFYCRPIAEREDMWDTQTCATKAYTDKGKLSSSQTSPYPPRTDVVFTAGIDDDDVRVFASMNPFDVVSRATPIGGETFRVDWQIPEGLPTGEYVVWVEASKEFDQNEHHDYPEPEGIPWADYGAPYRGQPSVVYRVPFLLMPGTETVALTADYAGYGDPDGLDGELRAPDESITTGVPGSGASRLLLTADGDDMYRVRARALPAVADAEEPGIPRNVKVLDASPSAVSLAFTAPGDDGYTGTVAGYEVRYLAGEPVTAENFEQAIPAPVQGAPRPAGQTQVLEVGDLLPRLEYHLGIRAYDECKNYSGLTVVRATTADHAGGAVDACFVATAAYGSLMQQDVEMLRRFRDRFLRTHVTGELLVQSYYTFGPALARLIAPSDTLRRAARASLAPLVERVRTLAPGR